MQLLTNEKNQPFASRISCMGLLLAFALILSYVELLIPFQSGIPGIKLGLANLAVVLCLYLFGWREALLLTVLKALLGGFLFGSLFMILYSLAGALTSAFVMILLKKAHGFHLSAVSAAVHRPARNPPRSQISHASYHIIFPPNYQYVP